MKSYGVTIQIKATEQYFPVVMFIMLHKVALNLVPRFSLRPQRTLGTRVGGSNFSVFRWNAHISFKWRLICSLLCSVTANHDHMSLSCQLTVRNIFISCSASIVFIEGFSHYKEDNSDRHNNRLHIVLFSRWHSRPCGTPHGETNKKQICFLCFTQLHDVEQLWHERAFDWDGRESQRDASSYQQARKAKNRDLKQKIEWFVNKSITLLRAYQIAGITSDLIMDVINDNKCYNFFYDKW